MTSSCILMSICVLIYVNKLKKLFFRFCGMNKFKSVLLFFKICISYYLYFIFNKDCCCYCCCCIFYQCLNICTYLRSETFKKINNCVDCSILPNNVIAKVFANVIAKIFANVIAKIFANVINNATFTTLRR